jgi:uncharacterized repeat protein (TIGR01451 family)
MKYLNSKQLLIALVAIFGVMVGSYSLATTTADFSIINKALLSFDVGATSLSIKSAPTGNAVTVESALAGFEGVDTTFEVDRKIDVLVTAIGTDWNDGASVIAGQQNVVLKFAVSNVSNDVLGFSLTAHLDGTVVGDTSLSTTGLGIIMAPPASIVGVFVEDGTDTLGYDTADNRSSIHSLAQDSGVATVYVVLNMPIGAVQDTYNMVTLVAQAASTGSDYEAGAGSDITTDDSASPDTTAVQNVFADGAGDSVSVGVADIASNGQHSDTAGVRINGANLRLEKTVAVIWDPINANTNAKAIPGAYVQYTIVITNNGAAEANLTTLADSLADELTLDIGVLAIGCNATGTITNACISYDPDFAIPTSVTDYLDAKTAAIIAVVEFDNDLDGVDFTAGYASGDEVGVTGTTGAAITVNFDKILNVTNMGETRANGDLNAAESITITFNGFIL